ncbi:MAG: hypothetical protein K8S94_02650 [Planctomycetia bacterium]|nr:hypothetical protein [Planctomycetia bacterium]
MRFPLSRKTRWFSASCAISLLISVAAGTGVSAADYLAKDDSAGLVEMLAATTDMRPADTAIATKQPVRQVAPVAKPDRLSATSATELFSNSKAVLPLLVSDLEPSVVSISRPLTGSSVGARPSLPWSRVSASR